MTWRPRAVDTTRRGGARGGEARGGRGDALRGGRGGAKGALGARSGHDDRRAREMGSAARDGRWPRERQDLGARRRRRARRRGTRRTTRETTPGGEETKVRGIKHSKLRVVWLLSYNSGVCAPIRGIKKALAGERSIARERRRV